MTQILTLLIAAAALSTLSMHAAAFSPQEFPKSCAEWSEFPILTARQQHSMCYDSLRDVTVLYGGDDGTTRTDTWEWDGKAWTRRAADGPPEVLDHVMVFDSWRDVSLLIIRSEGDGIEIWEWDGSGWEFRTDNGPELARPRAAAFDSDRGVAVVLVGGFSIHKALETWEWDGTDWALRDIGGIPHGGAPAMAYDAARKTTILFGGSGDAGSAACSTRNGIRFHSRCHGHVWWKRAATRQ